MIVQKILSGGQTGVDRAALDWAMALPLPHGGWCPKGRRAEDGMIPGQYRLTETPSAEYTQRTEWNVRDTDATLILSLGSELTGGSAYTAHLAREMGKPYLHLMVEDPCAGAQLRAFVAAHQVTVLNVAGPRASEEPRVAALVAALLDSGLR